MGRRSEETSGATGRRRERDGRQRWRTRVLVLLVLTGVLSIGLPSGAAAVLAPGAAATRTALAELPSDSTPSRVTDAVISPPWSWPVVPARIAGAYAAPPAPYAAGHRGIDLAATPEQQVTAPAEATVRFAGVVVDRPVLTLDHGGGVLSSYEPLATDLVAGQPVARGSMIGLLASSGHCAASCLHVGVRVDGAYVSPLLFFDRVPPAVLLPLGGDR